MRHGAIAAERGQTSASELVWLLGQPHLSDYLGFVRDNVVGGAGIDPKSLVDEWRSANDLYYELEKSERGIAEKIRCRPLPKALKPLEAEVRAHPWFREAFADLPTTFELVELDRLIVSQNHVERPFTDGLAGALGAEPDPAALFRFCLPLEREPPPVRIRKVASDRWLFSSGSTDFRAHEPRLLRGAEIPPGRAMGPLAAMLGIGIGFGSNFMSAIRSGKRLLLQNGYHRAYALRSLGLTHAPCIVEEVTRKDELKITASEAVCEDPEFYFAAARPPLLKDLFDPRLARVLQILPIETQIEVELKVRRTTPTDY